MTDYPGDNKKYCPQCNTLLEFAQNSMLLCSNCCWLGDYTKALSAKKDAPDMVPSKPQQISQETFNYYTIVELGNLIHLLAKRAMQHHDRDRVKVDLYNAQYYLNIMQAKLNSIKENL